MFKVYCNMQIRIESLSAQLMEEKKRSSSLKRQLSAAYDRHLSETHEQQLAEAEDSRQENQVLDTTHDLSVYSNSFLQVNQGWSQAPINFTSSVEPPTVESSPKIKGVQTSTGSPLKAPQGKDTLLERLKLVQFERERLLKKASQRIARRKAEQTYTM